jgi:hypothetical protein
MGGTAKVRLDLVDSDLLSVLNIALVVRAPGFGTRLIADDEVGHGAGVPGV